MNPTTTTVPAYFASRMLPLNPRIRSEASAEAYRIDLEILSQFYRAEYPSRRVDAADPTLAELCPELVAGAAAWRARLGRSSATCNRLLRHVCALWRFAADDELLAPAISPPPRIRKHREPKRLPEAWSPAELSRLIDAASRRPGKVGDVPAGLWWLCLLSVCYWTGVRISAVMAIRTVDVDLAGGWLKLPAEIQKHFADQRFDLSPDVVALLRQLDAHGRKLPTLFADWPHDRTARPWPRLNSHFREILAAAELPAARSCMFHKLRRTFATTVAAAAGPAVAQSLLGHASPATTARYLDPRYLARPRVSDLLPPLPTPAIPPDLRIVG